MKRKRPNVSSARKSAASAPGENEAFLQAKAIVNTCKQLQDDIKKLGLRIKRHEDKIKSFTREENIICGHIQDLRVTLSQFNILERPMTERGYLPNTLSEMVTVRHIGKHKNSAAGILSELKASHGTEENCGVVGIVATHGKVDDSNISRSEPQIIFPECSGTSCPPADYGSLDEQMRKKELEREVLQEELQREVTRLHDVKSEFLVKKKEYLRFLDGGSPQCSGSGISNSSPAAEIDPPNIKPQEYCFRTWL